MELTKEELESIEIECMRFRNKRVKEELAIKAYKNNVGMEPCCARKALEGDCLCWQDRW